MLKFHLKIGCISTEFNVLLNCQEGVEPGSTMWFDPYLDDYFYNGVHIWL